MVWLLIEKKERENESEVFVYEIYKLGKRTVLVFHIEWEGKKELTWYELNSKATFTITKPILTLPLLNLNQSNFISFSLTSPNLNPPTRPLLNLN